ncbi:MAG TPA: DUF177 domain-containing protein [Oculatellaceae cyanobacterium]
MKVSVDELKSLPGQKLTLEFKETLPGLATNKPVVGTLIVSSSASGLKVAGEVKTLLKLECDRCLHPYFQSLTVCIDEKFVPSDLVGSSGMQKELQPDDFVETLPDSGIVDISDVVYQAVTLATPSYCRCGPECPGPPAKSESDSLNTSGSTGSGGVNGKSGDGNGEVDNTDPRWKNLKTLFPKNDSQ